MKILLAADLHLTDKEMDLHRWELFPWMEEQVEKHKIDCVAICGDLTDSKDRHPATLVNRFSSAIESLAKVVPVLVLKGNHDYKKVEHPFFRFLGSIPNVTFVDKPYEFPAGELKILMLPHTRTPETEWERIDFDDVDVVLMHQPVIGAKTSDFYTIEHGLKPSYFNPYDHLDVFSGDIHAPQIVGPVEYIGAPYRTNFGDDFEGRCLILDTEEEGDDWITKVSFPTKSRMTISIQDPEQLYDFEEIEVGDQVKVTLKLRKSEFHEWKAMQEEVKEIAEELGWELHGVKLSPLQEMDKRKKGRVKLQEDVSHSVNPVDLIKRFADREKLPAVTLSAGIQLVNGFTVGEVPLE